MDYSFWKDKKVFITGHTGFKGSWLTIWLKLLGAKVYGYALKPPTDPSLYERANVAELAASVLGDIRDLTALKNVVNDVMPEIVIHMAAQPIVRESYRIPVETYETNVMGTVNILEAVRGCSSVRAFVNVTTDKVYENREWVWGYRESEPFGGHDPYSNSKACSELVTSSYRSSFFNSNDYKSHGVAVASARAGNVIGGGDWAVDRIVPDCIRATLNSEAIIVRNPHAIRPWQHVLEPLHGYLALAQHLFTNGIKYAEGWNFGPNDEDCVPVGTLVKMFCEEWGENSHFKIQSDCGPHEANFLKLDCSKAKMNMNWKSVWNIKNAISAIVSWEKGFSRGENPRSLCENQINQFMLDAKAEA